MNCWLVFVEDCSRPCSCLSEHPLILNSNPGIIEGDALVIVEEDVRLPCCIAKVNSIKSLSVGEGLRVYIYLRDCEPPSEDMMNEIMKALKSINFMNLIMVSKVVNINQKIHIKC